jgi:hypothetical protein
MPVALSFWERQRVPTSRKEEGGGITKIMTVDGTKNYKNTDESC